jgi:hypothetical protein
MTAEGPAQSGVMPLRLRYCLLAGGAAVWLFGLVNQLHSTPTTVTYIAISLGIAALAWV